MLAYVRPWLTVLSAWFRERRDLAFENAALRQQLAMLERRRPQIRDPDRWFLAALIRLWPDWRDAVVVVRPETVVRWHRTGWRRYWSWRSRTRRRGRPRIDAEARELIMRLARENPRWGAVRIVGELRALGFTVSSRTVHRYRREVLRRPPAQSWRTLNHAKHIWAVDLFTVQTATLQTLHAIVFIAHDRRRIMHVNVTRHPTAEWVWRQLLEATPRGIQPRHLIRDRDRCYGSEFLARASRIGIRTILTPVRAPNANAVAERVIGTLRRECLDHLIVLNERHLSRVLHEYVDHYNATRPHRTLGLDSPEGREPRAKPGGSARVVRRKVLGGLQSEYERAA